MQFELSVQMDNAAFEDQGAELARILRKLADRVEEDMTLAGNAGAVLDHNGNSVGGWSVR